MSVLRPSVLASVLAFSAALHGQGIDEGLLEEPSLFRHVRRMLPLDGSKAHALIAGDFDDDGIVDVFVANGGRNDLYLGRGEGAFEIVRGRLPRHVEDTYAVAAGDLDGDFDLDLVLVGEVNRVYLNDGTGTFVAPSNALPTNGTARALALGDVNADGALDVVVGNRGGQDELYFGNGAGGFTDATSNLPVDADLTTAVALGDVNGDTHPDLMFGNGLLFDCDSGQGRLYLNDGLGVFVDASGQLPAHSDDTTAVVLGDVTGDGFLDAVVTSCKDPPCSDGQIYVYVNDQTGTFTESLLGTPEHGESVALADVDDDGDLDVAIGVAFQDTLVGKLGAGQNRLFLNDGFGAFTDATSQLPSHVDGSGAVLFVQADSDDDPDLFVGNGETAHFSTGSRGNRLHLNDGTGVFVDSNHGAPSLDDNTAAVALGDVDGDGHVDAFVVGGYPEPSAGPGPVVDQSQLLLNDGSGSFVPSPAPLPSATDRFSTSVALGDVDGDGDLDALLGNPYDNFFFDVGQENFLYVNQGGGVFVDETVARMPHFVPERGNTRDVLLRDLDQDGDLDIALAKLDDYDGGGRGVWLFLNDMGVFADATSQVPSLFPTEFVLVAAGDVDGDNDVDLVAAGGNPVPDFPFIYLLLNDGDATFVDAPERLPELVGIGAAEALDLGDADGDGDLDLFFTGRPATAGTTNYLYLNDGDGVFTSANVPKRLGARTFHDIDEDGDLDLVGPRVLFRNDGAGGFADLSRLLADAPGANPGFALGDLDRDGDVDAFVARNGQNVVWANSIRQLAWRALPRIGKDLVLDMNGPENGVWLLAYATGTFDLDLAFGTLLIDPASLVVAGTGVLDADGEASFSFALQNDPLLVGTTLYAQGLVGPPLRLTNMERIHITDL